MQGLSFKISNWEEDYKADMESGKGFDITNPEGIIKATKERTIDGIYSPLFGNGQENTESMIMYSCQCGNLEGKFFEGKKCEICNSIVRYNSEDIEKTGWLTVDNYYLIQPNMYFLLSRAFGRGALLKILRYVSSIDLDGNEIRDESLYKENKPETHYFNIGMVEFRNKFDEIFETFRELKPDNKEFLLRI